MTFAVLQNGGYAGNFQRGNRFKSLKSVFCISLDCRGDFELTTDDIDEHISTSCDFRGVGTIPVPVLKNLILLKAFSNGQILFFCTFNEKFCNDFCTGFIDMSTVIFLFLVSG